MFFSKCPFPILKIPNQIPEIHHTLLYCRLLHYDVFQSACLGFSTYTIRWILGTVYICVLHYMLSHTKWQLSINYRHSFSPFLWYIFIPACKTHLSKDCFYSPTSLGYNLKTVLPLCLGGVWLSTLLNKYFLQRTGFRFC